MTKITVVIPPHNFQGSIIEALESVKSQTYPRDRIEIILVDDGWNNRSVALARSFFERHGMQASVVGTDWGKGVGSAMNVGWRAATGDWIQFLTDGGLLAPNKLEVQASLISKLPENVGVICSSWQRLSSSDHNRRLSGSMISPVLIDPIILKLVSPHTGRLGPALFRKKAIVAVAGFSEETKFAVDEHFMLKIAGSDESEGLTSDRIICFETPSSSPLFFERERLDADSRYLKVGVAQQHLENVLIAQQILRQNQRDMLTPENIREIASLCRESLSDLYEYDQAVFQQYTQRLQQIEPSFIPTQTTSSRSKDWANSLALTHQWITSSAAGLASAISRGVRSLKYGLARIWHMSSDLFRAAAKVGALHAAAFGLTRPTHRTLATGALCAIAATLLLGGLLASGSFGTHGNPAGLVGQPQPSQKLRDGAPIIIVASTIYVEPSSQRPLPVEIGQPQLVPSDSVLWVRGLPAAVTLSEGRRVSADTWAVPVVGLSTLEIQVAASVSDRSNLTLTLVRADGSLLAEASTTIAINESTGTTTSAAAVANLPPGKPDQSIQETSPRSEMIVTLSEPTAPTTKPKPPHPRTDPTATKLPAPLPTPKPGSEQTAPQPVPVVETVPNPISEPMAAIATPANAETSSAMAPPKLDALPEAAAQAAGVEPPQATTDKINHNHEVAPLAPAIDVQRETKTASTAMPETSRPTVTAIPTEPSLATAKPDQSLEPERVVPTQEERQHIEKMIARGEHALEDGNVSVARQFFLRAAEAGFARGALLLASTYDPHEFMRLRIQGVQPNKAAARKWYTRARELGAALADERLLRLGAAE